MRRIHTAYRSICRSPYQKRLIRAILFHVANPKLKLKRLPSQTANTLVDFRIVYIYIYIYMCVCVCVCVRLQVREASE